MDKNSDGDESRRFREVLGISQRRASKVLGCSAPLMVMIEHGKRSLGSQRRKRIKEAEAAFAAGGMEAVEALPAFRAVRFRRPIESEHAEDMIQYRQIMGFSQREAGRRLSYGSTRSIGAIERGEMRISGRFRKYMENDTGMDFTFRKQGRT